MQLIAEDLAAAYGDIEVFSDLDYAFESGQAVAVVGPSGSGKTTLLSILGGLLRATRGAVYVLDDDRSMSAGDGIVAWVHQTNHALRRRSVLDNVAIGFMARGSTFPEAIEQVPALLAAVEIDDRASLPAGRLSGGEMQRLAIARALAVAAPFILADEPTGHLDPRTSQRIGDLLISQATARGQGVVIATHDPMLAERCDRVLDLTAYTVPHG